MTEGCAQDDSGGAQDDKGCAQDDRGGAARLFILPGYGSSRGAISR